MDNYLLPSIDKRQHWTNREGVKRLHATQLCCRKDRRLFLSFRIMFIVRRKYDNGGRKMYIKFLCMDRSPFL